MKGMNRKVIYGMLILALLASRLLLVSKHPGDVDPALYILSLEEIVHPPKEVASFIFNQEMSFGYYELLSIINRIVSHDISQLVIILNYLNAIFGTFLIFIFGLLAKRLAGEVIAILSMFILLLDHAIWNWSLYGHPGIMSVTFFIFSLYFFDKGATNTKIVSETSPTRNKQVGYFILSGMLALAALLLRIDIIFVFASYLLLYNYRKRERQNIRDLLLFFGLIFLSYVILKYLALGYVMGNTISSRIHDYISLKTILSRLVINVSLFSAGMGIFFLTAAMISIFCWGKKQPKLLPVLLLSIFPIFIVALGHMDFPRISIPIHPILALFSALTFERFFSKLSWGILGIIVVYIVQTAAVYYPLKKLWAHKFPPQPSIPFVVRPIPIGCFFSDRKQRWEDENRLYQHASFLSKQKGNILVICSRLHSTRIGVLLLQLCTKATLCGKQKESIPHYKISTPIATYRIFCRDNKGTDILPQLINSKAYHDYSVYFLNNIQHAFPETSLISPFRRFYGVHQEI
jgi:hypothetical protein